jgi:hypothetical protein
MVRLALDKIKLESQAKGSLLYEVITYYLETQKDHKSIAERFGKSVKDIKNYLYQARLKIKEYIKQEIASYASSREEYEHEIRYLSRYFGL